MNNITVIVDLDRGDCGKGRVSDLYAQDFDIVCRVSGGGNAGHRIVVDNNEFKLHHIPSGAIREKPCLLGSGMVINPKIFCEEIIKLEEKGINTSAIYIDGNAHVNLPYLYSTMDMMQENSRETSIGSTKKGITPAYTNKYNRTGIRYWDLLNNFDNIYNILNELYCHNYIPNFSKSEIFNNDLDILKKLHSSIKSRIVDGRRLLREYIENNKSILIEGAQGCWLDIAYGAYPFVTSSCTTSAIACLETGISPKEISKITGVFKAYSTYVGNGVFIGECDEKNANFIREKGHEFGTTTGRPRRVGWLSIPMIKDAVKINGITESVMTKIDVLSGLETIKIVKAYNLNNKIIDYVPSNPVEYNNCKPIYEEFEGWEDMSITQIQHFNDLPMNACKYIKAIEDLINFPIKIISYGPKREQFVFSK